MPSFRRTPSKLILNVYKTLARKFPDFLVVRTTKRVRDVESGKITKAAARNEAALVCNETTVG